MAIGLVDRLGQLIGDVRAPAEEDPAADELLLSALNFVLTSLTDVMQHLNAEKKTKNNGAHSELLEAFKSTELAGISRRDSRRSSSTEYHMPADGRSIVICSPIAHPKQQIALASSSVAH